MRRSETLSEFYKDILRVAPQNMSAEIGHFNVFKFEDLTGCSIQPIPFSRREYFKITFISGENKVHYADKTIGIKRQALFFANQHIPYNWEQIGAAQSGYSCVFTTSFFHHFGNPSSYPVFQPEGLPVIELTDKQAGKVKEIFEEMYTDWQSDYVHKYDRMRISVYNLLDMAVKTQSVQDTVRVYPSASQRITTQFLELLERQFPVEDSGDPIRLRSASDFAAHLSIHVNHLNKAIKEILHRPTSAVIHERILLEAKIMLRHSDKDIAEVAFALGFKENTHFNNFFKKHTTLSPSQFRIT